MTTPHGAAPFGGHDDESLQKALKLVRLARNPSLPGVAFQVAVAVAGLGGVAIAVISMGGKLYVAYQLPHLISGGFGGAALIAIGALLAAVLAERADRIRARHQLQRIVDGVTELAPAVARETRARHGGRSR